MIRLKGTSATLEIVLGGAVTTNQLDAVAFYTTLEGSTSEYGFTSTTSNNTTAVTLAGPAPSSKDSVEVGAITITNTDTVSADVTAQLNDGTNTRVLAQATLAPGETLQYNSGTRWSILESSVTAGAIQNIVGAMFSGNTETLITVTYQSGDGTVDFAVENDLSNYDASTLFASPPALGGTSPAAVAATTGNFAADGVPLTINSTNNNDAKMALQDSGANRGFFGAGTSYCLAVLNSSASGVFRLVNATGDARVELGDLLFITSGKMVRETVTDSVTASTTQTQAGATGLSSQNSRITTCANVGDSVRIDIAAVAGRSFSVTLDSGAANNAWVWPDTGDAIDGGSANARDSNALTVGETRTYKCFSTGTWRTV